MRKFAFFLPQFHEIPENNKWWGDGFTEWTNVKKAKPLFKGHIQPKTPLNDNYYNLLDIETMKWQTNLMKEYGLDGFIYYHYYFEGKLLLEKPAENLLKNKDINQPFFFCWANHSWNRSWLGTKEVLIKQTYGNKEQWEKHFQYLLPFFKDERYEKKDNMPLFMLFKTDFDCKIEMFDYINQRCIEEGFDGIYVIESYLDGNYNWPNDLIKKVANKSNQTKKILLREPNTSLNIYNMNNYISIEKILRKLPKLLYKIVNIVKPSIFDGNYLYKIIMNEPIDKEYAHCLFFEWDNTPRHSYKGYIITPPTKKLFFEIMKKFKNEEYIFINAWNEWAEGMMLEPTKENNYKYLKWIKEWNDIYE